jgi:hypothetical protein
MPIINDLLPWKTYLDIRLIAVGGMEKDDRAAGRSML